VSNLHKFDTKVSRPPRYPALEIEYAVLEDFMLLQMTRRTIVGRWTAAAAVTAAAALCTALSAAPARAQLASPAAQPDQPMTRTTMQATDEQLNQLFLMPTTPDKSAAGEAYVTGQFRFEKYPGSTKTYLYQLQGQYSFTDQIAVGGIFPVEDVRDYHGTSGSHAGVSDVTIYGQYKLDQLVSHDVVDLTAQADVILPFGTAHEGLGTGHFGVRPDILAYKAFDGVGPGLLGLYGSAGVTFTTNIDFRMGLAATYDYEGIVGVFEFDDVTGREIGGRPFVAFTPGVVYHGLNPWEFSVGFPFGVNDNSPDWGILLKATYAFQR
jgi:hypothetical protein